MKLGMISDLHIDDNPEGLGEALLRHLRKSGDLEAVLIPGDISSNWQTSLAFLADLESRLDLPVYFIPGNHDLWTRDFPGSSPEEIQKAFEEEPHCLSAKIIELGGWTLVGETGWFDGSFAAPRFSPAQLETMEYDGQAWEDRHYVRWNRGCGEVHGRYLESLRQSLDRADSDKIILCTHVVPRLDFSVQPPEGKWAFFNGLLGSADYGRLCLEKGVKTAVFGHLHRRRRERRDGIEWICPSLGNAKEWHSKDLQREVAEAFAELELD